MMEKTPRRLFVGGLFDGITNADLQDRFKRFGDISSVDVRARKDDAGNVIKTFAYMDFLMTDKQFSQCVATFNKTKWKGNEVQIQLAKESYLDRLKREREAASQVKEEAPPPVATQEAVTLVVKDATPGAAVEGKQDWVVGKYGTALPMVNIRTKDKKKVIRVDPSKYVHGVKRLDRGKNAEKNDIPDAPITQLTWELDAPDSEITRKRKGEFPRSFQKKKKVASAQISPKLNNRNHSSSSESETEAKDEEQSLGPSQNQYHSNTESEGDSSNDEQNSRKKTSIGNSTPKSATTVSRASLTPDVSLIVQDKPDTSNLAQGVKKVTVASKMLSDIMASAKKALGKNATSSGKKRFSPDLLYSGNNKSKLPKEVESSSSDSEEDGDLGRQKSTTLASISKGDLNNNSGRREKSITVTPKMPLKRKNQQSSSSLSSEDDIDNSVTQTKCKTGKKVTAKQPSSRRQVAGKCEVEDCTTENGMPGSVGTHEPAMKSSPVQKKKRVRSKQIKRQSEKCVNDVKHIEFDIGMEDSEQERVDSTKQQSSLHVSRLNHPVRATVSMADEYASGFRDDGSDIDDNAGRKGRGDDHGFSSEEDLLDAVASGRVQKLERIAKFAIQRYSHIPTTKANVPSPAATKKAYNSDSSDSEINTTLAKTKSTQQKKTTLKVANKKTLDTPAETKLVFSPTTNSEGKSSKNSNKTKQRKAEFEGVRNECTAVKKEGRVIDPESVASGSLIDDSSSVSSDDAVVPPIQQSGNSASSFIERKEHHKEPQRENPKKVLRKKLQTESSSQSSDEESDEAQGIQANLKKLYTKGRMEEKLTASQFLSKLEKKNSIPSKTIKKLTNQDSDGKHAEANKKRLESVKQRSKHNLAQKSLLQKALSVVDSQPGKRIVFDSDSEEDYGLKLRDLPTEEVSERSTDQKSVQQESKLLKQGEGDSDSEDDSSSASSSDDQVKEEGNKKKISAEMEKKTATLFKESDASDDESDVERFRLRPEYEGKAGRKLMRLQTSVFGNDPRFKMNEKFRDSDEEEEEGSVATKEEATVSTSDAMDGDLTSEREQAMAILQGVVGKKLLTTRKQNKKFKDINALTYDPTRQDHEQFEVKVDAAEPAEKKKKKKKKVVEPEEPMPEVSKERFFEVEGSLAEAFKKDASEKPFSILAMLGRRHEVEEKKPQQDDGTGKPIETGPGTLSWGDEQFESDSDDDHRITEEDNRNDPTSASEDPERLQPSASSTFFFSEEDGRIKAGVAFFSRTKDLETIREKWLEQRPALIEAYRMKGKRFRSAGSHQGRGAVRGQGQWRGSGSRGRGRGRGHSR